MCRRLGCASIESYNTNDALRASAHPISTAHWIERVGLPHVKKRILDDVAGRKAAYARFLESQKYAQIDPWAERASQGVAAHEFNVLKNIPVKVESLPSATVQEVA